MNNKKVFDFLKILFSLAFISFILYYFFGRNTESLQRDLLKVDYKYVGLSMLFGGWAYINRGLRWIILINALGYKTSKINSIAAVSIGYFTNLFIPRAGEISRCASLKKSDKIPLDKLFGTILIERVIDFIALIIFLILIILLKSNEIIKSINEYQQLEDAGSSSLKIILLCIVLLTTLLIYILKHKIKELAFYKRIKDFLIGIQEGFKSIRKMQNKALFWFHTSSIWIMYFLMTYICFQAIPETAHLGVSDGLFLLVLGGIGMVIPAPGGIGSYHLLVMIGLIALQIPEGFIPASIKDAAYDEYNPAMLFPFVVHTAQTTVAIILGSIGLWILALSKKEKNVIS